MESLCSRSNVLDETGDTPFSELPLNSSQIGMNNSSHKMHMSNEEQTFVGSENDSFTNGNKNSFQCSELPQDNKSLEGTPSTMEKISMLLGAHFPEDSKLLANPKGIIKSYLSVAAANDPDKFDSYRKLCVAHVNEYYKHLKGDAGALCLVCNVPCQHWNTLQRHLQTHINFRPFSCELCGRTFYSQSKLKRHQVIHNDIKPYKCPVCERRLGRPEHLKRHLLVHTDSKPFGCSSCSHTTKRLDGIRRHIKRKHGADGAKIVEIEVPFDSQVLSNVQQTVVLTGERPPIAVKVKKKKKKKKLGTSNSNPNANTTSVCPNGSESGSNLLGSESHSGKNTLEGTNASQNECLPKGNDEDPSDVGSGFGACDLRMFANDSEASFSTENHMKNCKERFPSCGQKLSHVNNEKPSCRLLVPSHPMHLLYQKLTRSPPITDDLKAHSNPLRTTGDNQSFNSDPRNLPHPEIFPTNSISSDQQRYLPSSGNGAPNNSRHVNSMLLNPPSANSNLSHYSHPSELSSLPAEMMISQYFQSHQRFAPPVWGFANPNYPNYWTFSEDINLKLCGKF